MKERAPEYREFVNTTNFCWINCCCVYSILLISSFYYCVSSSNAGHFHFYRFPSTQAQAQCQRLLVYPYEPPQQGGGGSSLAANPTVTCPEGYRLLDCHMHAEWVFQTHEMVRQQNFYANRSHRFLKTDQFSLNSCQGFSVTRLVLVWSGVEGLLRDFLHGNTKATTFLVSLHYYYRELPTGHLRGSRPKHCRLGMYFFSPTIGRRNRNFLLDSIFLPEFLK